jgi:hypothetical protein
MPQVCSYRVELRGYTQSMMRAVWFLRGRWRHLLPQVVIPTTTEVVVQVEQHVAWIGKLGASPVQRCL